MSRSRFFSKENTFRVFLSQVLDADGGCIVLSVNLQSSFPEYNQGLSKDPYCPVIEGDNLSVGNNRGNKSAYFF